MYTFCKYININKKILDYLNDETTTDFENLLFVLKDPKVTRSFCIVAKCWSDLEKRKSQKLKDLKESVRFEVWWHDVYDKSLLASWICSSSYIKSI